MATQRDEIIIVVPKELTLRCKGLSLDVGSTGMKAVYRTQEDLDEAKSESCKFGRLRCKVFGLNELKEGLRYAFQRAALTNGLSSDSNQNRTLYSTGVGGTIFGKQISEALNVKLVNLDELICFTQSFFYLASRLPRHHLLERFEVSAAPTQPMDLKLLWTLILKLQSAVAQGVDPEQFWANLPQVDLLPLMGRHPGDVLLDDQTPTDTPLAEAEPGLYPCMMVMLGSAFACLKVDTDGSFTIPDVSTRGAKSFFAMGALLTGCKTIHELMELAERGSSENINEDSVDVLKAINPADGDDTIYVRGQSMEPGMVFCFGKIANAIRAGNETHCREDLARALLYLIVDDIVHFTHLTSQVNGCKRVFFCGGFCSSPLVRRLLTREMARRNMVAEIMHAEQHGRSLTFDFIKMGHYLGAVGCMATNLD